MQMCEGGRRLSSLTGGEGRSALKASLARVHCCLPLPQHPHMSRPSSLCLPRPLPMAVFLPVLGSGPSACPTPNPHLFAFQSLEPERMHCS